MSVFSTMLSQAGSAYDTALTGYQNTAAGFYGAGGAAPEAAPAAAGGAGLGVPGLAQTVGLMSSAAAPAATTAAAPAAAAPATPAPAAGGITAAQGQMYQEEYRAYQAAQAGQTSLLAAFMRKYPNQRMPTI